MQRACGIGFGVATHGLFAFTVWHLFRFLYADTVGSPAGSLWNDVWLAGQFAAFHSLLLHPSIRQRLTHWIPCPFYGCFFCVVTCVTLLGLFSGWRSAGPTLWRLSGWSDVGMQAAFFVSWVGLFYSLYLSGFGYQTGFTPWWCWVRNRPVPDRAFRPRSVYRLLRHPVYLSFLGLIWFNPVMTFDRLLLAMTWSGYILIGSYLKDERVAYFLGEAYRTYQEQVPGYPLIPFGPLGRRKLRHAEILSASGEMEINAVREGKGGTGREPRVVPLRAA